MKDNLRKEQVKELYQYSTLDKKGFLELLNKWVYPSVGQYSLYGQYFTLSIAALLFVSGVLFFFAFNWQEIPWFVKFGIVIVCLIAATSLSMLQRFELLFRQISLLCACVLVGILFAVFGQVYQTGANAYDLFIIWFLAITPWVFVSNFTPTWLFYLVLANVTFILYQLQINTHEVINGENLSTSILLLVNIGLLFIGVYFNAYWAKPLSKYYMLTAGLVCSFISTTVVGVQIFSEFSWSIKAPLVISLAWIVYSYFWSMRQRDILYYIFFLLSVIISVLCVLIRVFELSIFGFLAYFLFMVGAIVFLIKRVYQQHKLWNDEK